MTRERVLFASSSFVLLVSMAAIGRLPSPHVHIVPFLLLYAAAFAAYALAARTVLRSTRAGAGRLCFIFIVCALAHACVIPAQPDLSTDIHRYAWEGRVVLHGGNPFVTPPDDSTLAAMRDAEYRQVTHESMSAIYPPLAQGAFALTQLVYAGPVSLKVLFSLFNLGTVLVLFRLLRRRGACQAHALLFAWNPLVIVEAGLSGHLDAMAVFFLVLGLELWESGRRGWSSVVLGASALVKYLALATLPWLARRRYYAAAAILLFVIAAGYTPFWSAGSKLFTSLRLYTATWYFNGPPFFALSAFLGSQDLARRLLFGVGIAFVFTAALRERDLARFLYLTIGCALLVSPTVYPWYLTWIAPFLALYRSRAWIAFSALVMLSYAVWIYYIGTGAWRLPGWLLAIEYAPFYLLLLQGLRRTTRRGPEPA
jgi:alpha-1,6-mannosyltransferase